MLPMRVENVEIVRDSKSDYAKLNNTNENQDIQVYLHENILTELTKNNILQQIDKNTYTAENCYFMLVSNKWEISAKPPTNSNSEIVYSVIGIAEIRENCKQVFCTLN